MRKIRRYVHKRMWLLKLKRHRRHGTAEAFVAQRWMDSMCASAGIQPRKVTTMTGEH